MPPAALRSVPARQAIRTITSLIVALIAVIAVIGMTGGTASAHGDEGEMTVTVAEQFGARQVRLEVGLVYANDGHLAEDAQVSALFTGDDGRTHGPIELERLRGSLYAAEATLPSPGLWVAAVTSTGPDASAEVTIEVPDVDTTVPPTTAPPTTPTAGGVARETADPGPDEFDDALLAEDDPGAGGTGLLAALVIVGVALAGAGVFVGWRRKSART